MFSDTIVVSWGSVAELWLDPTDSTADFVVINWHDPAATLAAKYAAYGAALDYGVDVNTDPGVQHVATLTRLLGGAPERVKEADTLHYIWDGEVTLRFDALDDEFQPSPVLNVAVGADKSQIVIGYAAMWGLINAKTGEPESAPNGDAEQSQTPDLRVIR